jgi:hypothetical protein
MSYDAIFDLEVAFVKGAERLEARMRLNNQPYFATGHKLQPVTREVRFSIVEITRVLTPLLGRHA